MMPTGMSDFVNTFFKVEEVRMARQRQQMLERESRTNQARLAVEMATMVTSAPGRMALTEMLGDPAMGPLLMDVVPVAGALGRYAAMRGFEDLPDDLQGTLTREATFSEVAGRAPEAVATGQLLEQFATQPMFEGELPGLAQAFRSRAAAGTTPGALGVDLALARQSPEDLETIARITSGLELSAFEMEQIARWAEEMNFNWTDLEQRGAFGMADLMIRVWAERMRATGREDLLGQLNPNELFQQLAAAMIAIDGNPESDFEMVAQAVRYNTAVRTLTDMGILFSDEDGNPVIPMLPTDPSELRPGLFGDKFKWLRGKWDGSKRFFFGWRYPGNAPRIPSEGGDPEGGGPPTDIESLLGSQMSGEQLLEELLRMMNPPTRERPDG